MPPGISSCFVRQRTAEQFWLILQSSGPVLYMAFSEMPTGLAGPLPDPECGCRAAPAGIADPPSDSGTIGMKCCGSSGLK